MTTTTTNDMMATQVPVLLQEERLLSVAADGSDEDSTDDDQENVEQEGSLLAPSVAPTPLIYHKQLLLHYASTLCPPTTFVNTLTVSTQVLDTSTYECRSNDLKREVAFYNHAKASVLVAKAALAAASVPYKRPSDYFAEMLKSDAHMSRVKDKLIFETKKMGAVEERKKSVAHKKVAKQVQAATLKDRSDAKKDTLAAVSAWKKQRKGTSSALPSSDLAAAQKREARDEAALETILKGSHGAAMKRKREERPSDGLTRKSRQRQAKDGKFGSGNKGKLAKQNDRKSTRDDKSFSRARNNSDVNASKSKGVAKSKTAARPGKARREKGRK